MNQQPDPLELEALLARAERDPAASHELDFLCDLTAAAERAGLAAQPAPRWLVRPWLLPAAASLLFLAAGALWFLRRDAPADERQAWRTPPPFEASPLRAGDAQADELARVMEPYTRAAWPAARDALASFLATRPAHATARFYLGVVLAELGERGAARAELARAAAEGDGLLADHARLRGALLALEDGEVEAARATLAELAAGDGPFARPAGELLRGIE